MKESRSRVSLGALCMRASLAESFLTGRISASAAEFLEGAMPSGELAAQDTLALIWCPFRLCEPSLLTVGTKLGACDSRVLFDHLEFVCGGPNDW